jgi:hypothetical protein
MVDAALAAEVERRFTATAEVRERVEQIVAKIDAELFDKQIKFVTDDARFKAARCTRRAGKTELIGRYATRTALQRRGLIRIWGITRLRVKQLHWKPLTALLDRLGVAFKSNETELTVWLEGGGEIRLIGADKPKEVEKQRGDKTVLDIIDETQLFGHYLELLCDDVIGPCLIDMRGTLCLMGTPGVVCAGYWYEATRMEVAERKHGFSVHFWSVLDNPFLPHGREEIYALKARRGWADNHPTWLREYCGIWVNDSGALVYRYDEKRNGYRELPKGLRLQYFVAGADLGSGGSNDPMALVIWGWSDADPRLWEVFGKKYTEETTTAAMMDDFLRMRDDCGGFVAQVIDTGGGGKLTANDLKARHGVEFEPAQKTEKHTFQKLMNDDFTAGLLMVRLDGEYARELVVLPKDPDDELKEDGRFDNHCSDGGLYSWRKARHFWHQPDKPKPPDGTPEAEQQRANEEADALIAADEAEAVEEEDWTTWQRRTSSVSSRISARRASHRSRDRGPTVRSNSPCSRSRRQLRRSPLKSRRGSTSTPAIRIRRNPSTKIRSCSLRRTEALNHG